MTVSSMTGFGRSSGEAEWGSWVWEIKSVNGRGLDIRLNLPSGFEALDGELKRLMQARLRRGNLQVSLRIKYARPSSELRINSSALQQLVSEFAEVVGSKPDPQTVATLLSIKGVVESETVDSGVSLESDGVRSLILAGASEALEVLIEDRNREGATLGTILSGQISELRRLILKAEGEAEGQAEAIRERFRMRLSELGAERVVGEDRIATEVAVLAAKADVSEETDRLQAHLSKLEDILVSTGEIGRQLGFLVQELNREANTLCSKSALLSLTETGLAIKSVIDQLKEQSANVE